MYAYLTVVRYPRRFFWAGIMSMALFRTTLILNKRLSFYKLMGCGKNGTFDKTPDLRQWCILATSTTLFDSIKRTDRGFDTLYGQFISSWWRMFGCEKWTVVMEAIEGHGTWDGREVFGALPKHTDYNGLIGVLTRATIRISRLKNFWKHVDKAAGGMAQSEGFITSLGIGEIPWVKQATFSIWENKESMKAFSYRRPEHVEVIKKTREEKWYSEEMFIRFKILAAVGAIKGRNPLQGKL